MTNLVVTPKYQTLTLGTVDPVTKTLQLSSEISEAQILHIAQFYQGPPGDAGNSQNPTDFLTHYRLTRDN